MAPIKMEEYSKVSQNQEMSIGFNQRFNSLLALENYPGKHMKEETLTFILIFPRGQVTDTFRDVVATSSSSLFNF